MSKYDKMLKKYAKLIDREECLKEKMNELTLNERCALKVKQDAVKETVMKIYDLITGEFGQYIDLDIAKEIARRFGVEV